MRDSKGKSKGGGKGTGVHFEGSDKTAHCSSAATSGLTLRDKDRGLPVMTEKAAAQRGHICHAKDAILVEVVKEVFCKSSRMVVMPAVAWLALMARPWPALGVLLLYTFLQQLVLNSPCLPAPVKEWYIFYQGRWFWRVFVFEPLSGAVSMLVLAGVAPTGTPLPWSFTYFWSKHLFWLLVPSLLENIGELFPSVGQLNGILPCSRPNNGIVDSGRIFLAVLILADAQLDVLGLWSKRPFSFLEVSCCMLAGSAVFLKRMTETLLRTGVNINNNPTAFRATFVAFLCFLIFFHLSIPVYLTGDYPFVLSSKSTSAPPNTTVASCEATLLASLQAVWVHGPDAERAELEAYLFPGHLWKQVASGAVEQRASANLFNAVSGWDLSNENALVAIAMLAAFEQPDLSRLLFRRAVCQELKNHVHSGGPLNQTLNLVSLTSSFSANLKHINEICMKLAPLLGSGAVLVAKLQTKTDKNR